MPTLVWDNLPPDAQPCPMACGGLTDDPYGGPCTRCWNNVPADDGRFYDGRLDDGRFVGCDCEACAPFSDDAPAIPETREDADA